MINRFSCTLNGVSPQSVHSAIRVTDLTELPPRLRVTTVPTARHGLRLLRRVRESLTVRVSFLLADYDPVSRREALAALHAWACPGGILTVSDRPGQQLQVECDTLPMMSALCWSDEISIDFTAYAVPFWETAEETSTATTGSAALTLPGTADDCPVCVEVANTGPDALTALTLQCGDTQIAFEGLAIPPGIVLSLGYRNGLLYAEADGVSVLMQRTASSSDCLLADAGSAVSVAVTADQHVSAIFHGRGRFL